MMGIRDLLHETWTSILANKGRSFLTILGIIIGIASVIAMTSLVGGMRNMLIGELGFNQARIIQISAPIPLNDKDLETIQAGLPGYEAMAGIGFSYTTVTTTTEQEGYMLLGVTQNYFEVTDTKVSSGRGFTDDDLRQSARVVIIGRGVNHDVFGDESAPSIGSTLYLGSNQEAYTVIGIVSGDPLTGAYSQIYTPMNTLQDRITGWYGFDTVFGLVAEGYDIDEVLERTISFLAKYQGVEEDMIFAYSMKELIDQLNLMMTAFSAVLTMIASISLFVGGIGIMNMMLTSVSERTREIGLRRSLGARTSDITQQFLAESVSLCLAGGFFGLIFGFLGALLVAAAVGMFIPEAQFSAAIGIESVVIAVIVCVTIGLAFGYYPARRAAKLDPVDSLRYQ
ncbi:MAG: ABC transporter permease [Coriobacteriia bacterium]|nr:ABC transporter permease [Coriobacteriia bacterium]